MSDKETAPQWAKDAAEKIWQLPQHYESWLEKTAQIIAETVAVESRAPAPQPAEIKPHSSVIYTDLTVRCHGCKSSLIWRYDEEKDQIDIVHTCAATPQVTPTHKFEELTKEHGLSGIAKARAEAYFDLGYSQATIDHEVTLTNSRIQEFWNAQAEWSRATFGSDEERDHIGPLKHLAKEAVEAQVRPPDRTEIADCQFLVFDAARRSGMTLAELFDVCDQKLIVNKARKWSRPTNDNPVEHVREGTSEPASPTPEKCQNLDIAPGGQGECVSCGLRTIYVCPFCKVMRGQIRWLCEQPDCREKHETVDCARTPARHSSASTPKGNK